MPDSGQRERSQVQQCHNRFLDAIIRTRLLNQQSGFLLLGSPNRENEAQDHNVRCAF